VYVRVGFRAGIACHAAVLCASEGPESQFPVQRFTRQLPLLCLVSRFRRLLSRTVEYRVVLSGLNFD
jgi:hypothetical protein